MTEPPVVPPPTPPLESPTGPGERKPAWPIVIGIISIALAGLGLVMNLSGLITGGVPSTQQGVQMSWPEWFTKYARVSALAGMAIAVLLLAAGIALVRRRTAARPLHMTYAVLGIISALVGAVVGISVSKQVEVSDAQAAQVMRIAMLIGGIFAAAIAMVYPIFLLIWFDREKIRQQMQSWA